MSVNKKPGDYVSSLLPFLVRDDGVCYKALWETVQRSHVAMTRLFSLTKMATESLLFLTSKKSTFFSSQQRIDNSNKFTLRNVQKAKEQMYCYYGMLSQKIYNHCASITYDVDICETTNQISEWWHGKKVETTILIRKRVHERPESYASVALFYVNRNAVLKKTTSVSSWSEGHFSSREDTTLAAGIGTAMTSDRCGPFCLNR